jgi:hypothetical protein
LLPGFALLKECRVLVVESFELNALDLGANKTLDGGHVFTVLRDHERKRVAAGLGAARAANAVDVVFRMLWNVKIDDVTDVFDVEPARGDVGGDKDFVTTFAKTLEGLLALALGAVGVKDRRPRGCSFSACARCDRRGSSCGKRRSPSRS